MESKELRIRNIVEYNNNTCFIWAIMHESVRLFDGNGFDKIVPIATVKPIQLTTNTILKMGWIWNNETNSFEKYPNGDARMHLQYRDVSNSWTMFNYVLKAMICDRIYYIHELQNLYFALTGEEILP